MPIPWNEDPPGSERQIRDNAGALLAEIAAAADRRLLPTVAMAQEWHRRLYRGVALPVPCFAGEPRDSDSECPELEGYEVAVGNVRGTPSERVPAELSSFQASAQAAVTSLDTAIHPFANGNGPTGRLWANWAALRFGLPPFVKPW